MQANRSILEGRITSRGLTRGEIPIYLEFAARAWGGHSPQARTSALNWLYDENPYTAGMQQDLLVLWDNERIIGAHHRMRVPWQVNRERRIVVALHDLYVLKGYRERAGGQGGLPPGLQIMLAALEGDNHVGIFGMTDIADQIYNKMRVPRVQLFWLYNILNAVKASAQKLGSVLGRSARYKSANNNAATQELGYVVTGIESPSADEIAEALTVTPRARTYPDWDVRSYSWRFFHPLGPRNVLLLARRSGEVTGRAVFSLGLKNGLLLARLVEIVSQENDCLRALAAGFEGLARQMNAAAGFAVTSSPEVELALKGRGWKPRPKQPSSRWFTPPGLERPADYWISGGAWDYGWDQPLEKRP